mmetsp:Transcript_53161/g.99658  ORF Transcript_53161/g.99658 Transcript_53161/m.99658 type:complete len:725 (-) Transcript_53161:94-2268(-)
MAIHSSLPLRVATSPAASVLFIFCLLPAAAIIPLVEESGSPCTSDAICNNQEVLVSSRSVLLQGHTAHSVTNVEKEDVLTIAAAAFTAAAVGEAAGEKAFHAPKEKVKEVGFGALISATTAAFIVGGAHIILFIVLLGYYPIVYAYNVVAGKAPFVSEPSEVKGLRWVSLAWRVTTEDAVKYIGLDGAMFLEFLNLAIKITACIGLPMALVVAPLNIYYGGGSGKDVLAQSEIRNVKLGSVLYWSDALTVWYVVIVVHFLSSRTHNKFKLLRKQWLTDMQNPQSHTILIQNLAEELCSDQALMSFMTRLFSEDAIESAIVVRVEDRLDAPCGRNGFVTFRTRRDVEVAMSLKLNPINVEDVNLVYASPAPADVEYEVLQQADPDPKHKQKIGFLLLLTLFILYLPLVFLVSLLTSIEVLSKYIPPFGDLCQNSKTFVSIWEGVVGPAALTILPGFIPTFLMMIIMGYFALPSISWCQSSLERCYFVFLVTFTLVIYSLSISLLDLYKTLLESPGKVFDQFLPALQRVSTFYVLFIPADIVTHTGSLLRTTNFLKFLWFKRSNDEEEAHKLAEPEDQDYYGIGSRTARILMILVITFVYCTIETFIGLLALVDFLICRVVYGYLMVFVETRKPDSGGSIWISVLQQMQFGLFLYVSLMTSIIFSNTTEYHAPAYLAGLAFLEVWRFQSAHLGLDRLPFEEVLALDEKGKQVDGTGTYSQPMKASR